MAQANRSPKRFPVLPMLLGLVAVGIVLVAGGFTFAASQETHDSFCASCHSEPESTFYQRAVAAQAADLASFHTAQQTRCIDCHSGAGPIGRIQAELLGARNAAAWYTHTAVQPARLTFPIQDQNCVKCHADLTQPGFVAKEQITIPSAPGGGGGEGEGGRGEQGRRNHWHTFLARWQLIDPTAGSCTSCHSGHTTGSTAQNGFLDAQTTANECNACHRVLRRG
jgi:hypothetical protein